MANNTPGTRAEAARIQALTDGCETAAEKLQPAARKRLPAAKGASPMKTIKTTPQAIEALPAGAIGSLPFEELAAMLKAAEQQTAKPIRVRRNRVELTAEAAELFKQLGWGVPYVDASATVEPQNRQRFNNCKGAPAYAVALTFLETGPMTLTDLARLWLATGLPAKQPCQIAQQLANRAGRPILQTGDQLQLVTD
jgi:hypothetical protein